MQQLSGQLGIALLCVFAVFATKPTITSAKESQCYRGDQVLRVSTDEWEDHKALEEMQTSDEDVVEPLAHNASFLDIYVPWKLTNKVKGWLNNAKMKFEVLLKDVKRGFNNENPSLVSSEENNEIRSKEGHRLTFEDYHSLTDVHKFINNLPVEVERLGETVNKNPIYVVKISSGKANAPAMWIDGGIHGREWISTASVLYILKELVENRTSYEFLQHIDLYVAPLMNPDGYEYSHESKKSLFGACQFKSNRFWRKNRRKHGGTSCRGTDLNRNWGFKWRNFNEKYCDATYPGNKAFSERETFLVSEFLRKSWCNLHGFVTFHSYGQKILYPWSYTHHVRLQNEKALREVGISVADAMKRVAGKTYEVGNSATLLYPASGTSMDWARGSLEIKYSYTIELRGTVGDGNGFFLPVLQIKDTGKEALAAVKTIAQKIVKEFASYKDDRCT